MKNRVFTIAPLIVCASLAACSATETARVSAAVTAAETKIGADGQLFCQRYTAQGPQIFAMFNSAATIASAIPNAAGPAAVAILATNMGKSFVDAVCAQIGAAPVSPPASPAVPAYVVPPAAAPTVTP